jgi:hypothetical protein
VLSERRRVTANRVTLEKCSHPLSEVSRGCRGWESLPSEAQAQAETRKPIPDIGQDAKVQRQLVPVAVANIENELGYSSCIPSLEDQEVELTVRI